MEYTPDYEARDDKRAELIAECRTMLGDGHSELANRIVDAFCTINPPQDPPMMIEMITANHGGFGGGRSRKPGNIVLNWRRLVRDSSDLVLTGAGAAASPWLIPFAALSIFNKLWTHSSVELTREQASCLFAMWNHCGTDHRISSDEAFAECSALFAVFKWPTLERDAFDAILRDLECLRCIERPDDDTIWLREWVRTRYS